MKKFMSLTLGLLLAATALSGCENTFQGAGRDVQEVGQKMENPGPN